MGLGFLVLVWGAEAYGVAAMTPVIFVFLYLPARTPPASCACRPVGLSAMNRLAPSYLASLIMGAWFYMTAVGNFVAGKIGEATGGESGEMSKEGLLDIYELFGWVAIGVGVVVLAAEPDRQALDAPRHARGPRRRRSTSQGRRRPGSRRRKAACIRRRSAIRSADGKAARRCDGGS